MGRRKLILIAVTAAMAVGTVVLVLWTFHNRRLHTLFEGPTFDDRSDHPEEDKRRKKFYEGVEYELSDYRRSEGMVSGGAKSIADSEFTRGGDFLEKPREETGWERGKPPIHGEWRLDAKSGATRVDRLRSRTIHRERWAPRFLTVTYPPADAVFPPNICPPFIEWGDVNNNLWQVTLHVEGDPELEWKHITHKRRWRIPDDVWKTIKTEAVDGHAVTLRVSGILYRGFRGKRRDSVHRSRVITFTVSNDPADNAIIYRLVDPPFYSKKTPDMFVRDVREKRHRMFLSARRKYCFNCHTFSSKRGDTGKLAIQVRYSGRKELEHHAFFSVFDIDRRRGRKIILPFKIQMTTWMSWSPDGTKLLFAANQQIKAYNPITFETQSIGQPTSDVAVYDMTTETVGLLPGASDDNTLEIYPYWTPGGNAVVYSSTESGHHPTQTRFDIMLLPYNDGRGGTPVRIDAASKEKTSNFYPRFSPDGRWMSWVRADYGSLIKASSDVWLMRWDAVTDRGSDPHRLVSNAEHAADSWHSWSSNSKWIVFASKRDDGIFARLYMTHIDDEGKASPAVRLPLEEPNIRMSFNIPEFLANVPPIDERTLFENISVEAEEFNVKPRAGRLRETKPR